MAKRRKIYVALALILVVYLLCLANEKQPTQNSKEDESCSSQDWKEYRSLVKIWPQLKQEKIESIRLTDSFSLENETFSEVMFITLGFRVIDANIVEEWPRGYEIPEENLPECVEIIDKVMKKALTGATGYPVSQFGEKMLIVTDKGKYIFRIGTDISEVAKKAIVYGEDWKSYELGKFIVKYFHPDIEYKYDFPSKEQVVAVLVYPPTKSPPLAFFGNKKLAEKLLFETEFLNDPNGIQGLGELVRFGRLCKFGVETRVEGKEIITASELKPKKIFEGRNWLEKIMDAYLAAIKEAEEKEKYYPSKPKSFNARLVFMTRDGDCWKQMGIDENSVFDDYIKSQQLKEYFDELGLTKELLAEK